MRRIPLLIIACFAIVATACAPPVPEGFGSRGGSQKEDSDNDLTGEDGTEDEGPTERARDADTSERPAKKRSPSNADTPPSKPNSTSTSTTPDAAPTSKTESCFRQCVAS